MLPWRSVHLWESPCCRTPARQLCSWPRRSLQPRLSAALGGSPPRAGLGRPPLRPPARSRRPVGLTFPRAGLVPLLVAVLSVAQWGVIQAFVPIEAGAAGSNPGLLFTADAIAV